MSILAVSANPIVPFIAGFDLGLGLGLFGNLVIFAIAAVIVTTLVALFIALPSAPALTPRGLWFLIFVLFQSALGLLLSERIGPLLAIVGFVLLAWFLCEWLVFLVRAHYAVPTLRGRRTVRADRRIVPIIWAGQEFEVVIEVVLNSRLSLPYVTIQDRPPSGCDRVGGRDDRITSLRCDDKATIRYTLRCPVPGEVRFEGVRVQIADFQGFFYHRKFLRQPATYLVLPHLADAEGNRRTTKSHNILPPPGIHRLRQSGGGSELHDLREYRPGDPPKMIAWKASARRDRLITKEFESDVPVRCTLFIDASQSVRIGPPRETMLNQITTIASGVAQAALSDRDHVGLTLFDDKDTEILPPARTSRHLIELLYRLARANSAAPVSPAGDIDDLMQLANPLAHEIYPDLMDRRINRIPFRMFWEPILDYRKAWLMLIPLLPFLLIVGWIATLFLCWILAQPEWFGAIYEAGVSVYRAIDGENWLRAFVYGGLIACGLGLLAAFIWFFHGLSGQLPPWYALRMRRKRLAAMLATLDRAPIGTEARYLDNDAIFADRLQRFLAEHHRRYPVRLFDEQGRYLFRSASKIEVLSRSLLRAVAHCRDNEMFVILADLFELEADIHPLISAIRVAGARHHQVLVICPWMPGIPVLDEKISARERSRQLRQHALDSGFRGIEAQLFRQTAERYHQAFQMLRHEFGKSGVLLVRAQYAESVRLILNRMDRLRGVRARR
jgi:uncharacterized protein (DUF58 family)